VREARKPPWPFGVFHEREAAHWDDSYHMHQVISEMSGTLRMVLLEMVDRPPLTRPQLRDLLHDLRSGIRASSVNRAQVALNDDLQQALELGVLEQEDGRYSFTPRGRELAEQIAEDIPRFTGWLLAPGTVALVSVFVQIVLGVIKVGVGVLSRSAGLLADGIDTTVDTISAVLVWLGVKYDRERLVAWFILVTMFASAGGVGLTTWSKAVNPGPVEQGAMAAAVALVGGLVMLALSAYQYLAGRRSHNIAILSQSLDSRNHFWTSLLVLTGIVLSFVARRWSLPALYYADAAASGVIGLLILYGTVGLLRELLRPADEDAEVAHFMATARRRLREKIVFDWLRGQLGPGSLSAEEIGDRFRRDFCEQAPRMVELLGLGYQPQSLEELRQCLRRFVAQERIVEDKGRYWLAG